jgi:NhaP-type Na+/H+ or K+/H+ antiporter
VEKYYLVRVNDSLGSVAFLTAVLLLRHLPAILLLYRQIASLKNLPAGLFAGWFGSVGVAAIFYAGYCLRRTGIQEVWLVCSLIICASILAHGLSASPLTRLYGKYAQKHHINN